MRHFNHITMKQLCLFLAFFPVYLFAQFNNPLPVLEGMPYFTEPRICDIDQNGTSDILIGSTAHRRLYVYPNDGVGTFDDRDTLIDGVDIIDFQAIDMNQDSRPDIVVLADSSFYVFENLGNNTFSLRFNIPEYNINDYDPRLVIADMNNDGLPDILINKSLGGVWSNMGGFDFVNTANYEDQGSTKSLGAADMNGDGFMDIVCVSFDNIMINLNDQTNQFDLTNTAIISTGLSPDVEDFVLHDIDGDSDIDLIVKTGSYHYYVVPYINDGSGNLTRGTVLFNTSTAYLLSDMTLTDINGDQFPDLLFTSILSFTGDLTYVYCFPGVAGGGFAARVTLASGLDENYMAPVAGDLVPGGDAEIVYPSRYNFEELQVLAAPSPLVYSDHQRIDWFRYLSPLNLEPLQLDQDDELEIYCPPAFYDHIGNDKYITTSLVPEEPAVAKCFDDLDHDGILDVILAYPDDGLFWHKGTANGTFSPITYSVSNRIPISVDTCTFYTSGQNQFVVLYNDEIRVHYESGGFYSNSGEILGSFTSTLGSIDEWDFKRFYVTDPNQLKWALIANGGVDVYLATSDEINLLSGSNTSAHDIHISDWDSDGLEDVIFADNYSIRWFKQEQNGTFSQQQPILVLGNYMGLKMADLDEDGDEDIVYSSGVLHWIENYGNGEHSNSRDFVMPSTFVDQWFVLKDLDRDGDPDVFTGAASTANNIVYLFKNDLNTEGSVSGKVFKDLNANGVWDNDETGFDNIHIASQNGQNAYTDSEGNFTFGYLDSAIVLSPQLPNWHVSTDSLSFTLSDSQVDAGVHNLLFGLAPSSAVNLAEADVFTQIPRCNTIGNVYLTARNTGTISHDGIMELKLGDSLVFIDAVPPVDSISNGLYYWHYDDLEANSMFNVLVKTQFPDFQSIGLVQSNILKLSVLDGQMEVDTLVEKINEFQVICAYDPNDKQVEPKGSGEAGFVAPGEPFTYTVRFQNTGTDTAFNVRVVDQLSDMLDLTSLEVLSSSHAYRLAIMDHNKLVFHFDSIMLPDSTADFMGSQGYIRFRIKHVADASAGTVIQNKAGIYFDLNPPVITNTVSNTLFVCDSLNAQISRSGTAWCENQPITFYTNSNQAENFNWTIDGQTVSTSNSCVLTPQNADDTLYLQVDNGACVKTDYFVFQESYEFIPSEIAEGSVLYLCPGESVNLTANVDENNQWYHNGAAISQQEMVSVNEFGTYVLEINNQGCITTDTAVVMDQTPEAIILLNGISYRELESCIGNGLTVYTSVSVNHEWFLDGSSMGQSELLELESPGMYVLIADQNGCTNSDTLDYFWTFEPVYTLDFSNGTLSADDSELFSYSWIDCATQQIIPLEYGSTFHPDQNGSYAAVLNYGGCSYQTDCFVVNLIGVDEMNYSEFSVHPNPVKEHLVLNFKKNESRKIALYDNKGRLLLEETINGMESELTFESYSAGFYMLHVETGTGWEQVKVVKE